MIGIVVKVVGISLFLAHSIFGFATSLLIAMFSVASMCVNAINGALFWCFSTQHFQATNLFINSLGDWILRLSWICIRIGVTILAQIYQAFTNFDNLFAVASHILDGVVWITSSWPLHVLAAIAVIIGFRAWISTSRRLDILATVALAIAVQIYVLTSGQVNTLTIAATCIALRAYISTSPRVNAKLFSAAFFGVVIYVFNPQRPDFMPVAALVLGIGAYVVSKDSDSEQVTELPQPSRIAPTPLPRQISQAAASAISASTNNVALREVQDRLCTVCGDRKALSLFPIRPTRRCRHLPSICDDDLKAWIDSQLSSTIWDRIRCPGTNCKELFRHEDMKLHASEASFALYETLQIRSTLSQIPDFRWCLNPTCRNGQIHAQNSLNPILTCNSCGYKACTIHNIKWHKDETCEQYDYRISGRKARSEERATEEMIKQTTKRCPRCKTNIEKVEGCDHMTCVKCRMGFCWLCFVDYELVRRIGNSAHRESCRHHTRNLRG
ncbi:uncharacterized protein LY89DRAFT_683399 [Mollisia scopiformis]|uniref:RBR-type E3 ubiquitin transferase n=1 Tax=Mollisia scopiformis TaxID=149040 RepID=A0A194XH95_MOLSC|nr:uncharacterized protein LY89DRAFT_683399 [Mollisia scopiformis]KUJ19580.1 hypothetical protein LY89DRAFT_683399 [Mollisia scopiformis]